MSPSDQSILTRDSDVITTDASCSEGAAADKSDNADNSLRF